QAPLQPSKTDPATGVAVSDTSVPSVYCCSQSPGQSMPPGLLSTVPVPEPASVTVRVCRATKLAPTERSAVIDTTQLPVPLQAPFQPVKMAAASGVAVRATSVPCE